MSFIVVALSGVSGGRRGGGETIWGENSTHFYF
jgi:hypothetical protein